MEEGGSVNVVDVTNGLRKMIGVAVVGLMVAAFPPENLISGNAEVLV